MHPVDPHPNPSAPSDLTARARIRDAALELFADQGFKGATVKQIAQAAGVSHGLLQHHYGSKDELRQACDDYVLGAVGTLDGIGAGDGRMTDPGFMSELLARSPLVMRYVARALAEGAPVAAELFGRGADMSEEWLSARWPDRFPPGADRTRDAAAVMAAMHQSTIVLHRLLSERMGTDALGGDPRIPLAMLDVYAAVGEFTTAEDGAGVRAALGQQTGVRGDA